MATLSLEFGTGFQLNQSGGLAMATGWDETRQYLERFAFTTALGSLPDGTQLDPEYIGDPTFGLNARLQVGQNLSAQATNALASALRAGAASAPGTNPAKPPNVTTTQNGHTFIVSCTVYLSNGLTGTLTYQVF